MQKIYNVSFCDKDKVFQYLEFEDEDEARAKVVEAGAGCFSAYHSYLSGEVGNTFILEVYANGKWCPIDLTKG